MIQYIVLSFIVCDWQIMRCSISSIGFLVQDKEPSPVFPPYNGLVVAAAANNGNDTIVYPAGYILI